jgi:prevent-host-death family protein
MASIHTSSSGSNLERRAHFDLPSVPASDLKNRFGEICQRAAKGAVAITRHQRAEFVLLPIAQYEELQQARTAPLDALATQFDALVSKMNTPAARRGVKALFSAKPAALGANAVKGAVTRTKHGR